MSLYFILIIAVSIGILLGLTKLKSGSNLSGDVSRPRTIPIIINPFKPKQVGGPSLARPGPCSDTDGGAVADVLGYVTGYLYDPSTNMYVFTSNLPDQCLSSDYLKEYYCESSTSQNILNTLYVCSTLDNYECSQGKCQYVKTGCYCVAQDCSGSCITGADEFHHFRCGVGFCAPTTTTTTLKPKCTDSDNGIDANTGGTVTYTNNVGITSYWVDKCTTYGVEENYCDYKNPSYVLVGQVDIPCPLGCDRSGSAGKCFTTTTTIKSTTTTTRPPTTTTLGSSCSDSDGGYNLATKGTTSGRNSAGVSFSYTDNCLDSQNLREYYCSSNLPHWADVFCSKGCSSGACQSGSTTTSPPTTTTTIKSTTTTRSPTTTTTTLPCLAAGDFCSSSPQCCAGLVCSGSGFCVNTPTTTLPPPPTTTTRPPTTTTRPPTTTTTRPGCCEEYASGKYTCFNTANSGVCTGTYYSTKTCSSTTGRCV